MSYWYRFIFSFIQSIPCINRFLLKHLFCYIHKSVYELDYNQSEYFCLFYFILQNTIIILFIKCIETISFSTTINSQTYRHTHRIGIFILENINYISLSSIELLDLVIPDWWMTYGRVCFVNCSPTDSLTYTNIHISAHSWGFLTWKSLEILYHLPFKLISSHTNTHKIPWKKIKKIKTFLLKLDHGAMKMCSYSRTL